MPPNGISIMYSSAYTIEVEVKSAKITNNKNFILLKHNLVN